MIGVEHLIVLKVDHMVLSDEFYFLRERYICCRKRLRNYKAFVAHGKDT